MLYIQMPMTKEKIMEKQIICKSYNFQESRGIESQQTSRSGCSHILQYNCLSTKNMTSRSNMQATSENKFLSPVINTPNSPGAGFDLPENGATVKCQSSRVQ